MPTDDTTDQLEQSIRLLWGVTEPGRRGPKPTMSVSRIVEAGIAVADREGLAAVSMQRVAAEVGRTTMSVYTYVPSKEILLELMMDTAVGPAPTPAGEHWPQRVENWAAEAVATFSRRPWLLDIPTRTPPLGPCQLAWFDALIVAIGDSGLDAAEALAVGMYLLGSVRELSRIYGAQDDRVAAEYGATLATVLDAERFPGLADLADRGAFSAPVTMDALSTVTFGLRRLVDGIVVYAADRGRLNRRRLDPPT